MEWYINDLSLHGHYADAHSFRASVEPLLHLMARRTDLRRRILCSRTLSTRPVTASMNLAESVRATRDQLFISSMLRWLSSGGPFWEDDRASNPDDYFHFDGEDVTDQGLGEAARRLIVGHPSASFSFPHPSVMRFAVSPLTVQQGLIEDLIGAYNVDNCWDPADIETASIRTPQSWAEMLAGVSAAMPALMLSTDIPSQLAPIPFHSGVAEKVLQLLGVLQGLTEETTPHDTFTQRGRDIYNKFFVGHRPLFTDESDANKRDFENELTFPNPSDATLRPLVCPWHGKIKFGSQYRIHFEWPRPRGQRGIKVVYIGPKITKH
jgi:hypothetical protein